MPHYFVPSDTTLGDLSGDGTDEAWQMVFTVVGWSSPIEEAFDHEHEDGETCEGVMVEAHPMVLQPCAGSMGHAPAHAWFGPGTVHENRADALEMAQSILDRLLEERIEVDELERMVNGAEAGDAGEGSMAAGD